MEANTAIDEGWENNWDRGRERSGITECKASGLIPKILDRQNQAAAVSIF
jgi:hypothetical protein